MFFNTDSTLSLKAKTDVAPTADLKFVIVYNKIAMNLANVASGMELVEGTFDETEDTILAPPAANQQFDIWSLVIRNDNDEINDVTISSFDSDTGVSTPIYKCKLFNYERLEYTRSQGWKIYDNTGKERCCMFGRAILEQSNPGTTLTDAFTALDKCEITSIIIVNTNGAAKWASVSIAKNGAADSIEQYIYREHSVSSNETHLHCCPIYLNKGDIIRVDAESSDVIFTINGKY